MNEGVATSAIRPVTATLLGTTPPEDVERYMARFVYDISGGSTPTILFCELTPGITIGREGSRIHVRLTEEELSSRRWPMRWVTRGGGVMLHVPGQLSCFPMFRLVDHNLNPAEYVSLMTSITCELCQSFGVEAIANMQRPGVDSRGRRLASVGVGIRSGVTTYGLHINVNPDLELFRAVDCDGDRLPMTSLVRESPTPVRMSAVRQKLLELICQRFDYNRWSIFHDLPTIPQKLNRHAVTARH